MTFKDEQEVFNLILPIIEAYKDFDVKSMRKDYKFCIDDLPEFYPNYRCAAKYAHRIRIHAETGIFPDDLFMARHPNQSDKEFTYMKENYKQNTLPVFVDYINTNSRAFSDGNWNIEYDDQDTDNEGFQHYVENEIEIVGSLKNYLKTLLPTLKAIDANGVIAVKPENIFEVLDEETGQTFIDDTKLVNPQPYYYSAVNVLSDPYFDDDYIILESTSKSEVDYNNQKKKVGHIFEVYDDDNIWLIQQMGKFEDYKFIVSLYYFHGAGKIQAQRLKGFPQYKNKSYVWVSPFLFACDLLDTALVDSNFLRCSLSNNMFPYRVMLGNKCGHREADDNGTMWQCDSGKIYSSKAGKYITCPSCKGSGLQDRVSAVGGQMLLNPSDMNSEGDVKFSGKAMEYVAPPTAPSELMMKKIDADMAKAYEVAKIKRQGQATGQGIDPANGTATKEILDQKSQYAAVKLFSDQCMAIFRFLNEAIGWQRYGRDFRKPVINDPVSIDFNSEQDYLDQITAAQNAGLAPTIIQNYIYKYLQAYYFNSKKAAAVYNLLIATDALFVLKQDDVLMKLNKGIIENWQVVLHDSSTMLIDELQMVNADAEFCDLDDCTKGFFALDFDEQKRQLIDLAKQKAAAAKSAAPTSPLQDVKNRLLLNG